MIGIIKEIKTDGIGITIIIEYFDGESMIFRGATSLNITDSSTVDELNSQITTDIDANIARLSLEKAKLEQCSSLVEGLKNLLGV